MLSICTSLAYSQTANQDIFLNIVTPIYESIPSTEFGGATFGPSVLAPIYGELAAATNGIDTLACEDVNDLSGKIAFADRGDCEFGLKVLNAQTAGALALLICNNVDEVIQMAEGATTGITIPSVHVQASTCATLKLYLENEETVVIGLSLEPTPTSLVSGTVAADDNENCLVDSDEQTMAGFQITATKPAYTRTTYTGFDGRYNLFLDTGDYVVEVVPPSFIWNNCSGQVDIDITDYDESFLLDLPVQATEDCTLLTVDISSPLVRRCFENNYTVNYCNLGSIDALDAYIEITLDPLLTIISSDMPFTSNGNNYTFDIGLLETGECNQFKYVAELSCDGELGMTICSQANIFPFDRNCIPTNANWDGSNIVVTGNCEDGEIQFDITNDSESPMLNSLNYEIIKNGEYSGSGSFLLAEGESRELVFPADGNTYRVQTQQAEAHPWNNLPSATVEACSTTDEFTTGFHLNFPVADYGDSYDELCQEIIGSFDPNDKQGFPNGYGEQHYIERNIDLHYLIRFQNTGTDTAFKVVVTDEISEHLDMRTLKPGASSHPYQLDITGRSLQFTFDNIMLPDSFVNEPASNGYFEFTIAQNIDVDLETVIENTAAIYFDFNEPVITNTTFHTVGENFLPTSTKEVLIGNTLVLNPNPIQSGQSLLVSGFENRKEQYNLIDIKGQVVQEGVVESAKIPIQENLQTGVYILKIISEDGRVETGKLIIN